MMSRNAWQEKCKFSHLTNTCEYFAKCGKSWLSSQSRLQQTRMFSSRTFISILLHLPPLTSSTRTSSSDSDFITIVRIEIRTLCDTTSAGKATNVPVLMSWSEGPYVAALPSDWGSEWPGEPVLYQMLGTVVTVSLPSQQQVAPGARE